MMKFGIGCIVIFFGVSAGLTQPSEIVIQSHIQINTIHLGLTNGDASKTQLLQTTLDFQSWYAVAQGPGALSGQAFTDTSRNHRWFRWQEREPTFISSHPDHKNQLILPGDPFLSNQIGVQEDPNGQQWVDFFIVLDNGPKVYFINSSGALPFHVGHLTSAVDPFIGMTAGTFRNSINWGSIEQDLVLGTFVTSPGRQEFAIQFTQDSPVPPEYAHFLYDLVKDAVIAPGYTDSFFPVASHQSDAIAEASYLLEQGISLTTPEHWAVSPCYSEGWALGRLVDIPHTDIEAAYINGTLLPTDILLTDLIPAEIPFLAGVMTRAPATPNSHVTILSQVYNIPFAQVTGEILAEAESLVGQIVAYEVDTSASRCLIDVSPAGHLPPALITSIASLKDTPALDYPPMQIAGSIAHTDLAIATPADAAYIGGKAANFGFLRREIPNNSPEAMAFSFDLWNDFMQFVLPNGLTLETEIANRLAPYAYPVDISLLDPELRAIRDLIKDGADFSPGTQADILAALSNFDDNRKIRFRSSTNVEDGDTFIGAGLYDSYSGCLADDLDGDTAGPSICDASKSSERGVFRALRKVYASFYNLNAVLERFRRGVPEADVGMAVLVHHSFPDEIEAANGVATMTYAASGAWMFASLINQVGSESVTNPTGTNLPERVNWNNQGLTLVQQSSLLASNQTTVLSWPEEYEFFTDRFSELGIAFATENVPTSDFVLEFEYKKLTDGSLVIKQIRRVPSFEPTIPPFFIGEASPQAWKVQHALPSPYVSQNVFAFHRLKGRWTLQRQSQILTNSASNTAEFIVANIEHIPNGNVVSQVGPLSNLPGYLYTVQNNPVLLQDTHRFSQSTSAGLAAYRLQSRFFGPERLLMQEQARVTLTVTYSTPQITSTGEPPFSSSLEHQVTLVPDLGPAPTNYTLQTRSVTIPGGASLSTDFTYENNGVPAEVFANAPPTASLGEFKQTLCSGLTSSPLVLTGYYAQTMAPSLNNTQEEFIFEPSLDPSVPAALLTELQAQNIKQIYFIHGKSAPNIYTIGFDDSLTPLN